MSVSLNRKGADIRSLVCSGISGKGMDETPYYAIATLIGENIRDKRIDADLSQAELGGRVFLSQRTISDYECGVRVPSAVGLFMISVALGCKPWELWD